MAARRTAAAAVVQPWPGPGYWIAASRRAGYRIAPDCARCIAKRRAAAGGGRP